MLLIFFYHTSKIVYWFNKPWVDLLYASFLENTNAQERDIPSSHPRASTIMQELYERQMNVEVKASRLWSYTPCLGLNSDSNTSPWYEKKAWWFLINIHMSFRWLEYGVWERYSQKMRVRAQPFLKASQRDLGLYLED